MTTYEAMTFTGDHAVIEDWAARIVEEKTGRVPDRAVFEGDQRGLYISPDRLRSIGMHSCLPGRVHVRHGEAVMFSGGEFGRVPTPVR